MSEVNVINAVKTITVPVQIMEMYSVSTGGNQGESTKLFSNWDDAWEYVWKSIQEQWCFDLVEYWGFGTEKINRLKKMIKSHFMFSKPTGVGDSRDDSEQKYLFNGSSCLPLDVQQYLESSWWWMTKHQIEIPDNLQVK